MDDGIKSRYNVSGQVSWQVRCLRRLPLLKAAHDKFSRASLLFREEERGYTRVLGHHAGSGNAPGRRDKVTRDESLGKRRVGAHRTTGDREREKNC